MRKLIAVLALSIAAAAPPSVGALAQDMTLQPAENAPIRLMRVDHMMIGVEKMDVMVAWYRDKLDFVVEKAWTVEGLEGIQLAYLVGHGFRLEFIEGGGGPRLPVPESFDDHFRLGGFQHLAFSVADVDETMGALERRGVAAFVPPTDYPVGAERRVAFVKDPEGNVIEFAGPLLMRRDQ